MKIRSVSKNNSSTIGATDRNRSFFCSQYANKEGHDLHIRKPLFSFSNRHCLVQRRNISISIGQKVIKERSSALHRAHSQGACFGFREHSFSSCLWVHLSVCTNMRYEGICVDVMWIGESMKVVVQSQ